MRSSTCSLNCSLCSSNKQICQVRGAIFTLSNFPTELNVACLSELKLWPGSQSCYIFRDEELVRSVPPIYQNVDLYLHWSRPVIQKLGSATLSSQSDFLKSWAMQQRCLSFSCSAWHWKQQLVYIFLKTFIEIQLKYMLSPSKSSSIYSGLWRSSSSCEENKRFRNWEILFWFKVFKY